MKKFKALYAVAIVGIICAALSSFACILSGNIINLLSIISTVISIVLGVVSIVYTYISGQETFKALEEIKKQNEMLVNKINHELSKENFNDRNIESVRSTIKTTV